MTSTAEITARFWKELKDDRTIMLGLDGVRGKPADDRLDRRR